MPEPDKHMPRGCMRAVNNSDSHLCSTCGKRPEIIHVPLGLTDRGVQGRSYCEQCCLLCRDYDKPQVIQ